MRVSSSTSLVDWGRSIATEWMPHSSQAARLLRTYTAEAGLSPTITTASPGRRPPEATRRSTAARTSAFTTRAMALPSMIFAGP